MNGVSKALSCCSSMLFGVAIAITAGLAGMNSSHAQSNECSCLIAQGTTGVVQSARGNVFVSGANGSVPAKSHMQLGSGSSVLVGPQSDSVVQFGPSCTLHLRANMVVKALPQDGQLCLAIHEHPSSAAGEATKAASSNSNFVVPGLIIGGLAAGGIAIAISDSDNSVSK